jgi:hypothetical protein
MFGKIKCFIQAIANPKLYFVKGKEEEEGEGE